MQRLPDTSLTMALAQGGREFFGWGLDRHIAADVFDALNVNTRVSGNWKKGKEPTFPEYPRPNKKKSDEDSNRKKVSVKDLYKKMTGR